MLCRSAIVLSERSAEALCPLRSAPGAIAPAAQKLGPPCFSLFSSPRDICSSRLRNCRGIELSSRDFKTVAISVTRAKPKNCRAYRETVEVSNYGAGTSKLSQYWSLVCSSRSRNCRGIELSSRDFKTVAISVTRAKLYCINTWFACTSPSPEAQSPAGDLASAYPPKPLLFTLLGVGA